MVRKGKSIIFWSVTVALALALAFGTGEAALRILYRDGGRTTFKGPGGEKFEKTYNGKKFRGPTVKGPKKPGVTRILVMGDSITEGAGVRDWRDLYPYRLLARLNGGEARYEMMTLCGSGREINDHLKILAEAGPELKPDIIIYQWYVNDLEVRKHNRPRNRLLFWRDLPFHRWFKKSYLYYFLDLKLEQVAPSTDRSYLEYLDEDYGVGSVGWARFRRIFFEWASTAEAQAEKVLVLPYPILSRAGEDLLPGISSRLKRMVEEGEPLSLPAVKLNRLVGENRRDRTARYGMIRAGIKGRTPPGVMLYGPYMRLPGGDYVPYFRMKIEEAAAGTVAAIEVAAGGGERVLAERHLRGEDFTRPGQWQELRLPFTLDGAVDDLEFRLTYRGGATLSVDSIEIPVKRQNVKIVDPSGALRGVDTHTSVFDSHPNEKAHGILAEVLHSHLAGDDE